MRSARIISHCQRCGKENTYVIQANETNHLYQICRKCRIYMTIDKINLMYEDANGDKIEENVFNAEK